MRKCHPTPDSARRLLCVVLLTLLQACHGDNADAPFARYLTRLAAALSIATTDPRGSVHVVPPAVASLQLPIPADGLDGIDILLVSGCDAQRNIGKRNTSLARLAKPSQRLLLDLEYLRLAPACIHLTRERNRPALADQLEQAWRDKQAQLPALVFNATLGSDEFRAFWLPAPALREYPRGDPVDAARALARILDLAERWLQGDYRADNREFELLLGDITGGGGGELLRGISRQAMWLDAADRLVQRRLARYAPCGDAAGASRSARQAIRLQALFLDSVEPPITRELRRYGELLTPVSLLERRLDDTLPRDYRDWLQQRDQRFALVARAPGQHLRQLQQLQRLCSGDSRT